MMIPTNEQAERAVLSIMMANETCGMRGLAEVDMVDFFDGRNREIFLAMKRLVEQGKKIDLPALASVYDDVGYLTDVMTELSFEAEFESYVSTLRGTRQRRELIAACNKISRAAEANEDGYLELAQKEIADITAMSGDVVAAVGMSVLDAIDELTHGRIGKRTGFNDLDYVTAGVHGGELIVVGGRPGMGKSAFAMNIATNMARRDEVVAVFSMEMRKAELLQRAAYGMSGCSKDEALAGTDEVKITKLMDAALELSQAKLYVDDRCALTAEQIKARCYRIKQRAGRLDLVVVDYLQLMRSTGRKNSNREQEVAEMSRSMKVLARDLEVPVILLSQLSRSVETREDKTPRMSDLRESGAIEQDADVVIFMYRPSEYGDSEDKREAYAVVAKNRNGDKGTVRLNFDGQYFLFTSYFYEVA